MDLGYQTKLSRLYNYQAFGFRSLGVFYHSSSPSHFKRYIYELYFIAGSVWMLAYNFSIVINFIILPTILEKITKVFFGLTACLVALIKLGHIKAHNPVYRLKIAFLYKHIFVPLDAVENSMFEKIVRKSVLVRNTYGSVSLVSLFYVFSLQVATNPHELAVSPYVPFDFHTVPIVILMHFIAFMSVGCLCMANIYFDSWSVSFLLFAQAQLEILEHRLRLIGTKSRDDAFIGHELRKCVVHHAEVVDFVETIQRGISLPMSAQILFSILALCSIFYAAFSIPEISNFMVFVIYGTAMFSQIFMMCYYSNEVTAASEQLSLAIYSTNWMDWDKVNRKLVLLMMLRFQKPILVRSIDRCRHFNLRTFTAIVNTSYSYFALMRGW